MSYRDFDTGHKSKPGPWERRFFLVAFALFMAGVLTDTRWEDAFQFGGHVFLWSGFLLTFLRYRKSRTTG